MGYVKKPKGMKFNATVKISVVNVYDEMQDVIVRTRSYTIINSDELKAALKNMRNDIGARILDMALYQPGFMVVKVKKSYDVKQIQPNKSRYIYIFFAQNGYH